MKHMKRAALKWAALCNLIALAATLYAAPTHAAISVATTLPEFADIAKRVGGDNVSVFSIAVPDRDYHRIEARPSDVQRVAKARLLVRSGMSFELWADALVNASGNKSFQPGGAGYVDASAGIQRLEVPSQQVTGASGDIHADGNPHFYYDPVYGKFIARNIVKGLIRVDPKNADEYRANYEKFNDEIDKRMEGWKKELAPYAGRRVVTYHKSYAYFMRRFGLEQFGTIEAKPGIPPSAGHVNDLIQDMKRDKIKAVVIDTIYPKRFPDLVTRETGAKYSLAPYSVGSLGTTSYFGLVDRLVDSFKQALQQ